MKTKYKILIGVIVLLVVIRLILPYVIVHYANDKLAHVPGYHGHVKSIDINLYRGAYTLNDFYLHKIDSASKKQIGFFRSGTIDLSLEWGALFQGAIVGKLAFNSPSLTFTKEQGEPEEVQKDTTDFRELLKNFMPLRIKSFEINKGVLRYVDSTAEPNVDVSLKNVHILGINLTNVSTSNANLPSRVTAQADVYEGTLSFHMNMNVLAEQPTFELDAELKNTNLVLLNDLFKAYGKFEVSGGNFGLYTEMAAKEGKFIGYVKPVIRDLKVTALQDKEESVPHKIWGGLVGAVTFVFKNQDKNQLATKIPIEGTFADPKPNIFSAVWEVLQNAFVQALKSRIDNEINMGSVKGN